MTCCVCKGPGSKKVVITIAGPEGRSVRIDRAAGYACAGCERSGALVTWLQNLVRRSRGEAEVVQ